MLYSFVCCLFGLLLLNIAAAVWPPGGGSDYCTYSIGDYLWDPTPANWDKLWNLRPIIGTYHLAPNVVAEQMTTMLARGQDSITLVLWYTPLAPNEGQDNVLAHMVNSSGGVLGPQQQQNLANVMKLITKVGFKRVFFRFATQGVAHPFDWTSWNEAQYQQNWAFQVMVRNIIYENFNAAQIPLLFDLCLETAGVHQGQAQNYTLRMWGDYTKAYGSKDTYGFSMPSPSSQWVTQALQVYDAVGIRPQMYAFDIYGDEEQILTEVYSTLVANNEGTKPVLVQECYLDDVEAYEGFYQATKKNNIPLAGIFQWPISRVALNSGVKAFSVNYPPDYTAYLYNVSGYIQAFPNPCNVTQGGSCNANITWTTQNAENPCIFVTTNVSPNKLFACGVADSIVVDWITNSSYYNFVLYEENDTTSLLLSSVEVSGDKA